LAGEETGGPAGARPRDHKKEENMRLINEALLRMATWLRRDEGQTLVEYALIIVLISVAAIVIMGTLGGKISDVFSDIVGHLTPT
jgi:pilus assembly protein Flp/PilA